jgi:hypothetical protein
MYDTTHKKYFIIVILTFIVVIAGIYIGRDIYMKHKDPCRYKTYSALMKTYPELEKIWNSKIAYLDGREAAEKIFSAQLELAVKRGTITEEQAMEKESKAFNQTLAGEERFDKEFQATCQRLTGTKQQ